MSASVSAKWRAALPRPHKTATVVYGLRDGNIVTPPLPVHSGQITIDRGASIRRSVKSLVFVDKDHTLVPSHASDLLAPYGNELQVFSGIDHQDGNPPEMKSLGVFGISEDNVAHQAGYKIQVTAFDRSRKVARNKYSGPYQVPAGTNPVDAIQAIITDRIGGALPGLTFVLGARPTSTTPLLLFKTNDDPMAKIAEIGVSAGLETFFDRDGQPCILPVPTVAGTQPAWTISGGPGGLLVAITSDLKDVPGFNGSIVEVHNSNNTAPIRSEIWDTDPASPTYYLGRYGKVPNVLNSQAAANITTQAQADAAVLADLKLNLGLTQLVSAISIPNPAMDEADVVYLNDPATGIDGNYLAQTLAFDLGPTGRMTSTYRKIGPLV